MGGWDIREIGSCSHFDTEAISGVDPGQPEITDGYTLLILARIMNTGIWECA